MRNHLLTVLFFFTFHSSGQVNLDSMLTKNWYDEFGNHICFDNASKTATLSFKPRYQTRFQYTVSDSLIIFREIDDNVEVDSVVFAYLQDSIMIYPVSKKTHFKSRNCKNLSAYKFNYYDKLNPWTFYDINYILNRPMNFIKLSISIWKDGWLEIDRFGHIFYNGYDRRGMYGHYRSKLSEESLLQFQNLLKDESFQIQNLDCREDMDFNYGDNIRLPRIEFNTTKNTHTFSSSLEQLKMMGIKTFSYLDSVIKLNQLKYQNYADGDSVEGVIVFELPHNRTIPFRVDPTHLGSYEDPEGGKHHYYKGVVDSVYNTRDTILIKNYTNKLMYFLSDTLIKENQTILLVAENIHETWFDRGRAFKKPKRMIFRRIISYKVFPPNHKLFLEYSSSRISEDLMLMTVRSIIDNNHIGLFPEPFPKPYKTRFGVPYPFLRPPHQIAFEEYVLPDWEEYIKQQDKEK